MQIKNRYSLAFLNISQNFIIILGVTTLMVLSGIAVKKNILTVGDFIIINTYLLQLYQPLNFLGSVYREIKQSIIDMENMFDLLKIKDHSKIDFHEFDLSKSPEIEFQNVSFSYDKKRKVLKNISFKIKKNQKVALVGPTGSGKSTIFRLLFKFYENYEGNIIVDKKKLDSITDFKLREKLGIIPQDKFNDTILIIFTMET